MKVWKGSPYPLGATWMGTGVNFALYSQAATGVDLCLFSDVHSPEVHRVAMKERGNEIWHIFLPNIHPSQLYGFRVYGPWDPEQGHRFNPAKVLLDPYSKAIAGEVLWAPEMFDYVSDGDQLRRDDRDNARFSPKSVVVDQTFNWDNDRLPRHALADTIIYETHVRGFSKLMETLDPEIRGTYSGIGSPQAIKYFKDLGITAVELLPVHEHVNDQHLIHRGLSNYWAYNTIGFFSPHSSYSSWGNRGQQVAEFKQMVKNLHTANIEVILDVVYNHTAEGNHLGPTLSFRGIDNSAYYRLVKDNPLYYYDYTGTGNTLNVPHPHVLRMIMDSLRYWITEMHVDGFRFDLASTLARELHEVSRLSSFFDVIHQDPIISQAKLIAEPWDVGEGGYQVGNFPVLWCEWNGKYRDVVRRYWKGDPGHMGEFAYRFTGSADLYQDSSKNPTASINFITAHDGFTLRDLVSYNEKHNEANGENNQDGETHNNSWNCGAEGDTPDESILKLRRQQQRNFLTTLFLSQGVPMLWQGDEYGRTQHGNNNAYCQDNEISWMGWNWSDDQKQMFAFTAQLTALRRAHPIFHRQIFFQGKPSLDTNLKDINWLRPDGGELTEKDWEFPALSIAILICGDDVGLTLFDYTPIVDDTFYLAFNAFHEGVDFILPGNQSVSWNLILDTASDAGFISNKEPFASGLKVSVAGRSIQIYQQISGSDTEMKPDHS